MQIRDKTPCIEFTAKAHGQEFTAKVHWDSDIHEVFESAIRPLLIGLGYTNHTIVIGAEGYVEEFGDERKYDDAQKHVGP